MSGIDLHPTPGNGSRNLRVLHFCTQFAGLGGIESVVRDHHAHDATRGIDSRFCVFWEPQQPGWERARFLGFRDDLRIGKARRRVSEALDGFGPDLVVWHTVWGWPYFDDLPGDGPPRLLFLHSDTPGLQGQLETRAWWADGFACVNDRLVERVREARPEVPDDRILRVRYPVSPAGPLPSAERPVGRPLVIGYCGRIDVEQKRVDRIPELVQRLDAAGIAYRMEFLGDGPRRAWLEEQLPDRGRFRFHGRQSGAAYWEILGGWDLLYFVSDYEGTPIALLEAMTAGVIPMHPAIGCGGDQYAAQVDPACVYPAGDLGAFASQVAGIASAPAERVVALRFRSQEVVTPHAADRYRDSLAHFQRHLAGRPRLRNRPLPPRPFPTDWLSFDRIRRFLDWKRRIRGAQA